MKIIVVALVGWLLLGVPSPAEEPLPPRIIELKTSDGTLLKASYFARSEGRP